MRARPRPQQGYRSAMDIIALARRYGRDRLDAACEQALAINAISSSSANAILSMQYVRSDDVASQRINERRQGRRCRPNPAG